MRPLLSPYKPFSGIQTYFGVVAAESSRQLKCARQNDCPTRSASRKKRESFVEAKGGKSANNGSLSQNIKLPQNKDRANFTVSGHQLASNSSLIQKVRLPRFIKLRLYSFQMQTRYSDFFHRKKILPITRFCNLFMQLRSFLLLIHIYYGL